MMESGGCGVLDTPHARSMTIVGWQSASMPTVIMLWSSKRLAEKFRAFQSIPPRQFDSLGKADPHATDDVRFGRARMQCDWWHVEGQFALLDRNGKRFAQLARPGAERSLVVQSPPAPHGRNAVGRLQRANQHSTGGTFLLADEVHAPVDAIGAIDI